MEKMEKSFFTKHATLHLLASHHHAQCFMSSLSRSQLDATSRTAPTPQMAVSTQGLIAVAVSGVAVFVCQCSRLRRGSAFVRIPRSWTRAPCNPLVCQCVRLVRWY
jgi:hypothetical protein